MGGRHINLSSSLCCLTHCRYTLENIPARNIFDECLRQRAVHINGPEV